MKVLKEMAVHGVTVRVFSDFGVKIYGRDQAHSDKIMDYIHAEGLLDDVLDPEGFKSQRDS